MKSLFIATLFSLVGFAAAAQQITVTTNIPGVSAFLPLPSWFNARIASGSDLAKYGLPPRPDVNADPAGFARWLKIIAAKRITGPFKVLPSKSVPQGLSGSITIGNTHSQNWSGPWVSSPATVWGQTSVSQIFGDWHAPAVSIPSGAPCNGVVYSEATWAGIDGTSTGALLQGGSLWLGQCINGSTSTLNVAWAELVPSTGIITAFNINPGDEIYTHVQATGPKGGWVSVTDLTTNSNSSLFFSQQSPPLVGNSGEIIVERVKYSGSLSQLGNYVSQSVGQIAAYSLSGGAPLSWGNPPGTFTMYANDRVTPISYVAGTYGNPLSGAVMNPENCAVSGGCH